MVWLDGKTLKTKGCPDVVVVVAKLVVPVLIVVACGLPNKFLNCDPLTDDAIALL